MKRVLVCKNLNYGASKDSTTANTATSPEMLREGTLGIYGISRTSANNANKLALIIDGGADGAGVVPDADFDGDSIFIALGTANGCWKSSPIDIKGNNRVIKEADQAPTLQVVHIGYNGTSGSLNLPTIVSGDEAIIKVHDNTNYEGGGDDKPDITRFHVFPIPQDTEVTLAIKLQLAINGVDERFTVKVTDNLGAGTAFTNSATVAAVKGATSLTTSAAHGVGVGDYVRLAGDLYQAVTGTASTTLVIDRPYQGVSETIANASALDLGDTAPTETGLAITTTVAGLNVEYALQGVIENATITYTTAGTRGKGTVTLIQALEDLARGRLGTTDKITSYIPYPELKSVAGSTYNVFTITSQTLLQPKGETAKVFKSYDELILGFDAAGDALMDEIEDILIDNFGF